MENETSPIVFTNTLKVLEDFQIAVKEAYRNKLVAKDHYASGSLWQSVNEVPIIVETSRITVQLQMNWYWKIIEEGLKPKGKYKNPGSFPGLFSGLLKWVTVKPTLPLHDYSGKLPNGSKARDDKQAQRKAFAAAAAHNILKYGTTASHCLAETVEETKANFEALIAEAISKDIDDGLYKAMGYFTGSLS